MVAVLRPKRLVSTSFGQLEKEKKNTDDVAMTRFYKADIYEFLLITW